ISFLNNCSKLANLRFMRGFINDKQFTTLNSELLSKLEQLSLAVRASYTSRRKRKASFTIRSMHYIAQHCHSLTELHIFIKDRFYKDKRIFQQDSKQILTENGFKGQPTFRPFLRFAHF